MNNLPINAIWYVPIFIIFCLCILGIIILIEELKRK